MRVAVVGVPDAGWRTIRERWLHGLSEHGLEVLNFPVEAERRVWGRLRPRQLSVALQGRAAFARAMRTRPDRILFFTNQYAALLPVRHAARTLIYGDCTNRQHAEIGYGAGQSNATLKRLHPRHMKRLGAAGTTFLCLNRWYAAGAREEYELSENQIVYLPSGVNVLRYTPAPRAREGRPNVLFIGTELQRKGGDFLARLIVDREFADVRWTSLTGSERLPEHPNLRQLPRVSPDSDALVEIYRNADLFVLPTRADSSPNVLIEAAACGVPAVATGIAGIPEIVRDGETGLLNDRDDYEGFRRNVLALVRDRERLSAYGAAARAHVEQNYSNDGHFDILLDALNRSIA